MRLLETKRVILRPYQESEREEFFRLLKDEKVMEKADGILPEKEIEKIWLRLKREIQEGNQITVWAGFEKSDNRYIGHGILCQRPNKREDWEVGFFLKEKEWGNGIATEICQCLLKYGFEEKKLREIYATVDDNNFASIKVLKKSGMSFLRKESDETGEFSVFRVEK